MTAGRAIWSGTLGFGLLSVQVKLHTATRDAKVSFNQVERATGERVRYRRVSSATGEELDAQDIVRGVDVGGRYVTVEAGELQRLREGRPVQVARVGDVGALGVVGADPDVADVGVVDVVDVAADRADAGPAATVELTGPPPLKRTIQVLDFVGADEVDVLRFDKAYHVTPDAGGARAFDLLVRAMADTGTTAVAEFVMRTRQHLAVLRVVDGALRLHTLRRSDEILSAPIIAPSTAAPATDREVELAVSLIRAMTVAFDPERYTDAYRAAVLALIEARAGAVPSDATGGRPPQADAPADLMAALEASLAAARREASSTG